MRHMRGSTRMSERSIVESRIKRKESEIRSLERKLEAARVYLQALKDVERAFDKGSDEREVDDIPLRKGSSVAQAREVIIRLGAPVHIDTLLEYLGKETTRENKSSLVSSLAAYVRRGEVFTRTAPNTFGLVELQHAKREGTPSEPPQGFGNPSSYQGDRDPDGDP